VARRTSTADPAPAEDHEDPSPERVEAEGARFVPNEAEQADLDRVAAGHPSASVLAAIEHAKADDSIDTDDPTRLPAEDGSPRDMMARVVDNAVVAVTIGEHAFVLTTDEATSLAGAIGAIMVELVR
jgi:hypothetical protein